MYNMYRPDGEPRTRVQERVRFYIAVGEIRILTD